MKNICIITDGFPTPYEPAKYTFVDQLVCAWCDMGYAVSVICPVPYFVGGKRFYKDEWKRKTNNLNEFTVYHPRYFSYSNKSILGINTTDIAYRSERNAILATIKKKNIKIDVLYSHFLPAGCLAGEIGNILGIPSFCAFGESSLWSIKTQKKEKVQQRLSLLKGIISVSTENKRVLIRNGLFRENDIGVFPNGVDHQAFYPRNKELLRKKYGIPMTDMVGIYTGAFTKAKGALRVQEAALRIPELKMIYLGGGPEEPDGDNIIFKGKIAHEQIPEWLGVADFFILPTLQEGCCNAIIEAMACGLPIISSKLPFNEDILDETMSLLIDPMNIDEIYKSLYTMNNDKEKRGLYSKRSLERAQAFDIVSRAHNIIEFMNHK